MNGMETGAAEHDAEPAYTYVRMHDAISFGETANSDDWRRSPTEMDLPFGWDFAHVEALIGYFSCFQTSKNILPSIFFFNIMMQFDLI